MLRCQQRLPYGVKQDTQLCAARLPPSRYVAGGWAHPSRRGVAARFFREDRTSIVAGDNSAAPKLAEKVVEPVSQASVTAFTGDDADTLARPSPPSDPTPAPSSSAEPPPAPSAAASAATPAAQPPGFYARRLLVFSGLVLGYAAYYLTRNSLTYTAPAMVADPALAFSLAQVGTMTSIFPIAYGMSKFVAGILGDRYSPTLLLGGGLAATAACNLAFGAGSGLAWFGTFWALNGLMQGVGAPSCARMLTSWFATAERGTYWGLWNVAHNTGGFLSPLIAASAASAFGWRWGMWAPGLVALALGAYVLLACRDSPQAAGFNPVEPHAPNTTPSPSSSLSSTPNGKGNANGHPHASSSSSASSTSASASSTSASKQPGLLRTAIDNVLSNPAVWALALTYFFVYVVRQGVTSWSVFYLIDQGGVADAAQAAQRVSGLELGGLVGGLAAGRLSDLLIRRQRQRAEARGADGGGGKEEEVGAVGVRVRVIMAYTAALAGALALFRSLPAGSPPALQWLSVAAIGFCIYGPQMLVGLCGAELVHPDSVGASQGVLGWVAYLGAANAGVPLSYLITKYGWSAYFTALTAACGVALLLLAPLSRLQSFAQRQATERERGQQGQASGGMQPRAA
ncbi:hypothetical protein HYH03_001104 [Edaphochlamys debaryana]|uniref:Major facilitator superfamily (MFS) profile domain-containing protein n=1 Tax=Edaphochlamys debaryana TaxID=47281 RepID=A0A835YHZ9_9CHLO|nr:hypothetical protein HYH03_001104 [Edaphochlamys debaryana]|eukprot:KAG2501306.1 hypothetical protein HYH03_001104 [Edaphochlamys debaryana]